MSLPHRLTCAFVAMLLTAAVHAQAPSAPRELDRVIAVVNTDIITANELAMRQRTVEQQLRQNQPLAVTSVTSQV